VVSFYSFPFPFRSYLNSVQPPSIFSIYVSAHDLCRCAFLDFFPFQSLPVLLALFILLAVAKPALHLLRQLQHDVRNLNILLRLVLGGDFEDDVLLVGGDGLLADGLDESGHPVGEELVSIVSMNRVWYHVYLLHGKAVLVL
jgi:hypothetical protein